MKAKNLFFIGLLVFSSFISNTYAQTYSAGSGAATAVTNNTNVGTNAGSNSAVPNSYENVAVGYNSSNSAATGALNTYVGSSTGGSGSGSTPNTVKGNRNCFFGAYSGNKITSGDFNIGIGVTSLYNVNSGSSNIALGDALFNNITGSGNIGIGYSSLYDLNGASNTTNNNIGIGTNSGKSLLTGVQNVFLGYTSGQLLKNGTTNVFIGSQAGQYITNGDSNIMIGTNAGFSLQSTSSLDKNTLIGFQAGYSLSTGVKNTFLGTVDVPNTLSTSTSAGSDTSSSIILADGDGRQRFYVHSNGFAGVGLGNNVIPSNTFVIKALTGSPTQSGFTASGLRLTSLPNTNFNTTPPTSNRRVLTVNGNGDVILVDDIGGGITNSCTTNYNVPVNNATGNLVCGQIYDNGASVSIGSPLTNATALTYNTSGMATTTAGYTTGNLKLFVNGVTQGLVFISSSDKKFKKDIKPIENALETVQKLEGKTYLWNKESNKEMNFDDGSHSGFLAQELEKVIPHLVVTNERGEKGVNYMELMPYLVEAIKEQQTQINDLKNQIAENFKAQNQDLIELTNTKIINVSPNPSNDVITVSLNIEKSVQTATLNVYDLNGKLLNSLTINDRDNNITRTLQKDNFGKGIYIVSLLVNGKSIDSKKIVFN